MYTSAVSALFVDERDRDTPGVALPGAEVHLAVRFGPATARGLDRLGDVRDTSAAGAILESVIAGRLALAGDASVRAQLALAAADRLASASVHSVADDLGVSERHLRRVFHETVGVNPKEFARLTRFRRALGAARARESTGCRPSWAGVAADAGYYDQAHLIAEFHALAGATPRALLDELRAAPRIGW